MAIWGIGANYEGKDVTDLFFDKEGAYVGYKEDEATSIYQMIYSIKPGDIIYIKSFHKQILKIKAIGIVLPEKEHFKRNYIQGLGFGVKVKWLKIIGPFTILFDDEKNKNNVYCNTLYEEHNFDIINQILIKVTNNLN